MSKTTCLMCRGGSYPCICDNPLQALRNDTYKAGNAAYVSGENSKLNPHTVGHVLYDLWLEGWTDALERNAETTEAERIAKYKIERDVAIEQLVKMKKDFPEIFAK